MASDIPHDGEPQRHINVELLDRIEQQITQHPESWIQSTWFRLPGLPNAQEIDPPCGTAFCVAGWAVAMSGHKLRTQATSTEGEFCTSPDGTLWTIENAARRVLGLTRKQGYRLFDEENSLAEVLAIFAELREEASR